ncbi:MAG TPA: hypothetical protein VMZ01_04670 [Aestuariivirga sp.]|nr:hypothetical protein [Aestuariivirga sp.]
MKTLAATLALTIMFLSAGAFAGNSHRVLPSAVNLVNGANVTVIVKNQSWPMVPCSLLSCK